MHAREAVGVALGLRGGQALGLRIDAVVVARCHCCRHQPEHIGLGRHGGAGLVEHQVFRQCAQLRRNRRRRVLGQIVDAHVFDGVQQQCRLGLQPECRRVVDLEARARAQGAHGAVAQHQVGAAFGRFHHQGGIALDGAVGVPAAAAVVQAEHVVVFQARGVLAADRKARGGAACELALAVDVPGAQVHLGHRLAHAAHQRLHGVAALLRALAVKANGRACIGGLGVVRRKDDELVAGRGLGVFLDAPGQAFFGQQSREEVVVALAVLGAVGANGRVGQEAVHLGGEGPTAGFGIRGEHAFDDVCHAALLEDLAAPLLGGQPEPGHEREAVARQAAVGAQRFDGADQSGASAHGAIGQYGDQRQGLVDQR
ncbi:hypothetical protein FQZ97_769060 [compost metagenome]